MFTDSHEGPGNEQSWVTHILIYRSPFLSIKNFSATPRGTTPAFFVFCRDYIVKCNAHPWSISFLVDLYSTAEFSSDWGYLWFTLIIIASKSGFLPSSSIGLRW